ncbi:MAG: DUF1566 domain-containing protein [Nitrospirae bacterium]|nr:DUF1566 domain-containing protein [Nitrospirota bacterium]
MTSGKPKLLVPALTIFIVFVSFESHLMAGTVSLPQTGETSCYYSNGGVAPCKDSGQDGDDQAGLPWPNPRFTNPDGTTPINGSVVIDQLTGLMWTRKGNLPNQTMTWQTAIDYVAGMNGGKYANFGYTDWRLPNVNELESLVNAGKSDTSEWLNEQGFINIQSNSYWSSTTYSKTSYDSTTKPKAWIVGMHNGGLGQVDKSESAIFVWPVRGGQ